MLVDQLIQQGYLKTPRIIDAFKKIKRIDFIPEGLKQEAEGNYPLSIGYGQTISQPLTVAFMLELLQPEPGDKVLDIGSGSGWVTALLAEIVVSSQGQQGQEEASWPTRMGVSSPSTSQLGSPPGLLVGKIYAIERIPELKEKGENNVKKYNFLDKKIVQFFCGDGTKGLPKFAPFDKIHVAAMAEEVPSTLKDQLAIGGRMVIPIKGGILKLDRIDNVAPSFRKENVTPSFRREFKEEFFPGFVFVPLIENFFHS